MVDRRGPLLELRKVPLQVELVAKDRGAAESHGE